MKYTSIIFSKNWENEQFVKTTLIRACVACKVVNNYLVQNGTRPVLNIQYLLNTPPIHWNLDVAK